MTSARATSRISSADPASTLHFVRDLVALRRELVDLRRGAYRALDTGRSVLWAWRRGDGVMVAVNLGDAPVSLDDVTGTVRIGTDRARDGEQSRRRAVTRRLGGCCAPQRFSGGV